MPWPPKLLTMFWMRSGTAALYGHLDDDRHSIRFDGLKKVDGASILGAFHYEPDHA